jgi:hypothetical protein
VHEQLGGRGLAQRGRERARRHRDLRCHLGGLLATNRDAGDRLKNAERQPSGLPSWLREHRLTALHSRAYFEELLLRDWQLAQRDSHEIGLTLFDMTISVPTTRSSTARRATPASAA